LGPSYYTKGIIHLGYNNSGFEYISFLIVADFYWQQLKNEKMKLKDKTYLVTGGTSGVGKAGYKMSRSLI